MIKPVVAITLGDPAGIGPEIILKTLCQKSLTDRVKLILIGDSFVLRRFSRSPRCNSPLPRFDTFKEIIRGRCFPCLLDCGHEAFVIPVGRVDRRCGQLSIDYLKTAIRLAQRREVSGIVTAPIHKQAWAAAGSPFPGHTEMLAAMTHTKKFAMAFYAKEFLTVLMSTHMPLKKALSGLRMKTLEDKILLTVASLEEFGRRRPRIAVAGVNPHAGEDGLLGKEEQRIFVPAIKRCQEKGINVSGPYSADTIYLRAAQGEFDAIIAPYHDQAMLAVKTLSFGHATNITLGLPFVRTSVDHGTAFDIAGTGSARADALIAAIEQCRELILARRQSRRRQ